MDSKGKSNFSISVNGDETFISAATLKAIAAHVAGAEKDFVDAKTHPWSCIDGREDEGMLFAVLRTNTRVAVLGVPGGFSGEMILCVYALDRFAVQQTNKHLVILELLQDFAESSNIEIYYHMDSKSKERLRKAVENSMFFGGMDKMTAMEKHCAEIAHVGCGHIRSMLQDSTDEHFTKVVQDYIKAFYRLMQDNHYQSHAKYNIDFDTVDGDHDEHGVIAIITEEGQQMVPRVAPYRKINGIGQSFFIYHPNCYNYLRDQLLDFLVSWAAKKGITVTKDELRQIVEEKYKEALRSTVDHLLKFKSVYNVKITQAAKP